MQQCGVIYYTLWGMLIKEAELVWEQGACRKSLHLPLTFAVNLKLLFKNNC